MAVQISISISDALLSDIDTLKQGKIKQGRSFIIAALLNEALEARRRKSRLAAKKEKR